MTAEAIARVVADLRAGRIATPSKRLRGDVEDADKFEAVARMMASDPDGPVVDATAIYQSLADNPRPVYVYEDHPCIAPPWPTAVIAYQNEHGNVLATTLVARDIPPDDRREWWQPHDKLDAKGEPIDPADHPIDWQRVRWITEVIVWIGGRGATGSIATTGPCHMWRFAIYEDGEPADFRWVQLLPGYDMQKWDMEHLTVLGALNFMNCRNVDLVEPRRPRAQARALARTGVRVSTINVLPVGRTARGARRDGEGMPLTSVRGHFATYGVEGRGLLFGKLAGRFWIPQHARGTAELGEVRSDYQLRPQ